MMRGSLEHDARVGDGAQASGGWRRWERVVDCQPRLTVPSLGSRYADVGRAGLKGRQSSDAAAKVTARHPSCALASGCAAALALIVYANSLPNGLVFDDETVIATNTAVRDPLAWRRISRLFLERRRHPHRDVPSPHQLDLRARLCRAR